MRISIIQDTIYWADKDANLQKTEAQLMALAGQTDLVVLPEMFTTGFCTNQLQLAETMNGNTIATLKKWAVDFHLAIVGSFIATDNGKVYNRAFFVLPTGEIHTADKRHLFTMGGEHLHFTAGNKQLVVNYGGFNISVLVCYDVRFPVWSRNVNNTYDLLIYVANFPHRRINDWDVLLKARAVENQAFVCAVNRVGEDGLGIKYSGHSVLLDYKAQNLLTFEDNETAIKTFHLDREPLLKYRDSFAIWRDADNFTINN